MSQEERMFPVTSSLAVVHLLALMGLPSATSQRVHHNFCCDSRMQADGLHARCADIATSVKNWTAGTVEITANPDRTKICFKQNRPDSETEENQHDHREATSTLGVQAVLIVGLDVSGRDALIDFPDLKHGSFAGLRYLNLSRNRIGENADQQSDAITLLSLKQLVSLDLSHNDVRVLPKVFSAVENTRPAFNHLEFLDLSHNGLRVLPPDAFRGAAALVTLNVSHNQLVELKADSLAFLASLELLDFSFNSMVSLPVGVFDELQQMKVLDLGHNSLASFPHSVFRNLLNLRALFLNANELSFVPSDAFARLKTLTSLDLSSNELPNLPANVFEDLQHLQDLDISGNQLKALSADTLKGLDDLKHLYLSHNQLKTLRKAAFMPLKNLLSLDLQGNSLTRLHEHVFAGLRWLSVLDLSHNQLQLDTQTFPEEIFSPLTHLNQLRLQGNDDRREASYPVGMFATLADLRHLAVDTFAAEVFGEDFPRLPRLRVLELPGCKLESLTAQTFAGFHQVRDSLTSLRLDGCPLQEIESCALCGLTDLDELTLTNRTSRNLSAAQSASSAPLRMAASFLGPGNTALRRLNISRLGLSRDAAQLLADEGLSQLPALDMLDMSFNDLQAVNLTLSSTLRQLHLSGTGLTAVPVDVLSLRSLNLLDLSNNQIRSLSPESLAALDALGQSSNLSLKISGNPLHCPLDCHHARFYHWLCSKASPVQFHDGDPCELSCWTDEGTRSTAREASRSCRGWSPSWVLSLTAFGVILFSAVVHRMCCCRRRKRDMRVEPEEKFDSDLDGDACDMDGDACALDSEGVDPPEYHPGSFEQPTTDTDEAEPLAVSVGQEFERAKSETLCKSLFSGLLSSLRDFTEGRSMDGFLSRFRSWNRTDVKAPLGRLKDQAGSGNSTADRESRSRNRFPKSSEYTNDGTEPPPPYEDVMRGVKNTNSP